MKRIFTYMITCLCLLVATSCVHKDLCFEHPHTKAVRVVFDWQDAPDADPEGMCVFFYPVDGGVPYRADFCGRDGGMIYLKNGEYRVLCYNNDTESVLYRNTDEYNLHEGYTREGNLFETIYGNASQYVSRTLGTEEQPVVISPDMMWGYTASDILISDKGELVITLYPHEQVCTYTYEVRNVSNLKHVTQVCGSISGMSGNIFFASEELGRNSVTIPFAGASDGASTIKGEFYTFGHHQENTDPHLMTLYIWMDDGNKYAYGIEASDKYNVTEQIHTALDKRHVHIVIDGLGLPQPIENGHGFVVDVDDWVVVEEDILL